MSDAGPNFKLSLTDEEIVFLRQRYLRELRKIEAEPMAVLPFSSYWNLSMSGLGRMQHGEFYEPMAFYHTQASVLLSGLDKDTTLWNSMVLELRGAKAKQEELDNSEELKRTDNYSSWHPLLLIPDYMSINGYLKLFPQISDADGVDEIVRKYENPESPDALPGAVTIDQHDAIHVMLARGALQADEMFVIGFTMGSTGDALREEDIDTYMHVATSEYKPPYRVDVANMPSFLLGVAAGREYYESTGIDISTYDFSSLRDRPVDQIRTAIMLDVDHLSKLYRDIEPKLTLKHGRALARNAGITDVAKTTRLTVNPRLILG